MYGAEVLCALYAGVTGARSRFPVPPDGEWSYGDGLLRVRDGWRYLFLHGAPYEMGRQHGELLRPVIQNLLDVYMRAIRLFRGLSRDVLLQRARRHLPFVTDELRAEMRGIADGAGLRFEDILIGHTFLESVQCIACACYAAWGSATHNGEMIFARNLEFFSMGVAHRCQVLMQCRPERGIPFLSLAWPGWCGSLTSVNAAGLCLGLLNVNRPATMNEGEPYPLLFRRLTQYAGDCDEAAALLRDARRTYSNNILAAQGRPPRRAVVLEHDADRVVVREPKDSRQIIFATNHFRRLGRKQEWPEGKGFARYPAMHRQLTHRAGHIALETDILSDRRIHLPNSLHCLIAAPERRLVRVSHGRIPAATGPWRTLRYDLDEPATTRDPATP